MTPTERIYSLLEEQKKKSADLCRYLGISSSVLAGWKAQNTIPPSKYLSGIGSFLGCSVDFILTGEREENETELSLDEQLMKLDAKFALYGPVEELTDKQKETLINLFNYMRGGGE